METHRHPESIVGKKIVVVIGGGFAGLNAAKKLSKSRDVFVVLIDQKNHHLFQPMLYQVATAGLNPADIAAPIRAQFGANDPVEVHWTEVKSIHLKERTIQTSLSEINFQYDYLILACGAQHSYFGHPEWEEFAPGLKTLEQATEIRRRILSAFELAESELDATKQRALLTFVVVGGGPTGVELAGAIADLSRTVLVHDFRRIFPNQAQVILLEAGPRLLTPFAESLSERTKIDLAELGVDVRLGSRVEKIDAEGVRVNGEHLPAKTICWAAGVQATPLKFDPELELDKAGRVKVNPDLSVPGFNEVFAVGDFSSLETAPGKLVPGLAPAAIQEGFHAAQMILNSIRKKQRVPFRYFDKGQMATIGKNRAVMQAGHLKMGGIIAWLAWLFVHILYLIGFNNRIRVLSQWIWSYVFSKRGSRLITERQWKLKGENFFEVHPSSRG